MGYLDISKYTIDTALREILVNENSHFCAGDISVGDNYITKDHGDYVEINIGASTPKGHVSYDLYFDSNGHLTGHKKHN